MVIGAVRSESILLRQGQVRGPSCNGLQGAPVGRMNAKKYLYEPYSDRVASIGLPPFGPEWDGATNFETK